MREVAWFCVGLLAAGCTVIFAPESRDGERLDNDAGRGNDGGGGGSDASPDIDADLDPNRSRLVFVTSQRFGYGGTPMSGIDSADAMCDMLAESSGADGQFLAWLSDGQTSPSARFNQTGRFVRADSIEVADDWADLTDGTLDAPIDQDENGSPPINAGPCAATVWSNTNADGTTRGGGTGCGNWTGVAGNSIAGSWQSSTETWTQTTCDTLVCDTGPGNPGLPIYCFQQ